MSTRVLVTGGAGYIGSVCVEMLVAQGHRVLVLDNLSEGHRAAIDPGAELAELDLADRERVIERVGRFKPEAAMHFAASALVAESMRDPSKYFRNNVGAGINLLDALVAAGTPMLVFSSTCATYGVPTKIPIDERHAQNPINPYGQSKLMFEQILGWYEKIHGLRHVNLRYFNAAGASERFGEDHRIETHLIPNVLQVALGKKKEVEIYGDAYETPDGTCIRDYIHIQDLAQAHVLAMKRTVSGCYNLGTGEGFSVLQVVEAARRITGHAIPVQMHPPRPGDPPRLVAAARKAATELGWKPQYPSLPPIVESAWRWHQKYPNGYGK